MTENAKDIELPHIAGTLDESILRIKTENRLSRNPDGRDFTEEMASPASPRPARGTFLRRKMIVGKTYLVSPRSFGVPAFFNYAVADGLYNLLFADKIGIDNPMTTKGRTSRYASASGKKRVSETGEIPATICS
jgi:hypothetical protein